jgi:MFS family permease
MPGNVHQPTRNFFVLAAYQILWRCGWIFKTESIVMPVVLDLLGGGAWARSFLPLLNRFGLSIPPLLMARRIKVMRRKKWALFACTSLMTLSLFALSAIWTVRGANWANWMPLAFLVVYALFFVSTGVNQMSFNTLQGKLVEAARRGRLMLVANVFGSVGAIALVTVLLPRWMTSQDGRFEWIFAFSACCFAFAALQSLVLAEPPDDYRQPATGISRRFVDVWLTLRHDAKFRRLAIIASLFGVSVMLFPHYQALARGDRMEVGLRDIVWWLVVQNAGTALFSLVVGPLADWRGNRVVLRTTLLAVCGAPILALALSHIGPAGRLWFPLVFLLVGLTPVTMRTLHNYTLEMSSPEDHPRYLSAITLCMATPIFFSPLVGVLIEIEAIGFDPVFCGIASMVLAGWAMTFGLFEPRHCNTTHPPEVTEIE